MHGRVSDLFRQKALAPTYQYAKGLFPSWGSRPGIALFRSARGIEAQNHGTGFIAAKFAINAGVWPILHKPRHKTLMRKPGQRSHKDQRCRLKAPPAPTACPGACPK
ncbi:hypothetical protein BN844_3306 [Pseudomonas sp. SHC52]|nr:hypothetical protein BN844_3306 [Pseudomonas sp. SHC52]